MDPLWDSSQVIRGTSVFVLFRVPKMTLGPVLVDVHVMVFL